MDEKQLTGDQLLSLFEALANPHRLRIIGILNVERKYVSQLAREMNMSRPLIHMHLNRLEQAGLVKSNLEISSDGKAMNYFELVSFQFDVTATVIEERLQSLSNKKKKRTED
ncbi:regulatory protein, ArsR [Bacillus sp. JCM 19046]|uniref:Transcriptional regulator n=1 Tax=Shouchella xiaoxiensis TaxID=766895 RepID=A0ABS2SV76_9BACI|nr:ArsR family transcriptional regulator [Shouchella xiaoxiensis]MBM7839150.1 putative transcriptional regulator [Shouchella xiaoxiensis]GAF14576.1 regulatory protein, ArsR [Bacillus sp. JCM 19045]GAF15814.1 regulatory protein, ArsR [Bacillus sp. JCM 19046]